MKSLLILLFPLCASAQWWKPSKKEIFGLGCMAVSGVAKGYHEAINYHGYGKGREWWDIRTSWKRKYMNYPTLTEARYYGSKTWLVWTTDANHLSKTLDITFMTAGITLNVLDVKEDWEELGEVEHWQTWKKVGYIGLRKILYPILVRGFFFEAVYKRL